MAQFLEGRLSEFSLDELHGARCRLQRRSDLKFFAGWVHATLGEQVLVHLKCDARVSENDLFNLEAGIQKANVGLPCVLARKEGKILRLIITGEPTLTKPGQEARYNAESLSVTLQSGGATLEAETVDISESGIGVLTLTPFARFANVTLIVRGGSNTVECAGSVRYSRPDPGNDGVYRVGIQVEFDDVLSRAMWQRLALSVTQSPYKAA
jgi:hypothetical protein